MFISKKYLRIMFDNVYEFIRVYDGTKYLVLFAPEKYDSTYDTIRYFITLKGGITYIFSHNYVRIKSNSYDYLPQKKALTLNNVIILIKSIFKKD